EDARGKGAQLLVLPELGLSGYTCGDLFFSLSTLVAGAERALSRLLAATSSHRTVVVVGLPVVPEGKLFHAAAVVQAGRVVGGGAGGRGAQDVPAGLQGVLRGALVRLQPRGRAQRRAPGRPASTLRDQPALRGRGRAGRRPGRGDLRGPLGGGAAEQLPRPGR